MSKQINPIRKAKVKQALREGKSAKAAALEANYAPATAINACKLTVVKDCQAEIVAELKASDITPELVINRLNQDKAGAIAKGDWATATRVDELLGKYIALFTDRQQSEARVTINAEEQSELRRLRGLITAN